MSRRPLAQSLQSQPSSEKIDAKDKELKVTSLRQWVTILDPLNISPLALPPATQLSSSTPAVARSRHTMFVCTGIVTYPPSSVHASAISLASACPFARRLPFPRPSVQNISTSPAAAIAI